MRTKLVFSLRQATREDALAPVVLHGKRECFESTRLTDGRHLLFKYREPRHPRASPPENTFCEHDNSRRRLYGSAENNISIRDHSRRGENGRLLARSLTNDDATHPPRPVRRGGRHLSPWKDVIFSRASRGLLYNRAKRSGNSSASINERARMIGSACLRKLIFQIVSLYFLSEK